MNHISKLVLLLPVLLASGSRWCRDVCCQSFRFRKHSSLSRVDTPGTVKDGGEREKFCVALMYHEIKAQTSSKFTFHVMWNMSEDVRHRWEITSSAWARERKEGSAGEIDRLFIESFIWKQKPLPKLLGDTLTSKNRQFLSRQQIFPLLGRLSGEIYDGVNKSRMEVGRRRPWNYSKSNSDLVIARNNLSDDWLFQK